MHKMLIKLKIIDIQQNLENTLVFFESFRVANFEWKANENKKKEWLFKNIVSFPSKNAILSSENISSNTCSNKYF